MFIQPATRVDSNKYRLILSINNLYVEQATKFSRHVRILIYNLSNIN